MRRAAPEYESRDTPLKLHETLAFKTYSKFVDFTDNELVQLIKNTFLVELSKRRIAKFC